MSSSSWSFKKAAARPGSAGTFFYFGLIVATIAASIITQIYFADSITISKWDQGCEEVDFRSVCRATTSVLRFSISLVALLCIELVGTYLHGMFYDSFLVFKFVGFIGILIGFFYTTSTTMLEYAWFARMSAFLFVIYQQVILISFAYDWNASWVSKSEASDNYAWLYALVATSCALFAGSITVLGFLFDYFYGCAENDAVLIITVILGVFAVILQLFVSETGSLLVSGVVCAYCTYLCYSAVTLNPSNVCNPTLSTRYQNITQGVGIALTIISLAYTAYSTAEAAPSAASVPVAAMPDPSVATTPAAESNAEETTVNAESYANEDVRKVLFIVIAIYITIAGYYAMVLTNWATLQSTDATLSNPKTGTVALWLQATGQWIALILYSWSLVAPRLFPDRDFS